MNETLQAVVEYWEANKFTWETNTDETYVEIRIFNEHGQWRLLFLPCDEPERLMVLSVLPLRVPKVRRRAVAEFITRLNHNLIEGSFDLNFDDGELRYRDCILIDDGKPTADQLDKIAGNSYRTFSQHLPVILSVAFGRMSPEKAMKVGEQIVPEKKTAKPEPNCRLELN